MAHAAAAACSRPRGSAAAASSPWLQLQQLRGRTNSSHLVPKFAGNKIKSYSSYKSRFKLTGTGKVMYKKAGYVHKRSNKSKSALQRLSGTAVMKSKYAKTVRKLGFKTRALG